MEDQHTPRSRTNPLQKIALIVLAAMFTSTAHGVLIGGIDFPEGAVSFADAVVSFNPGVGVGAGWDDPSAALGIPDFGPANSAVSLGVGGSLILQFTDNSLTTSGDDTADIHIFEIGAAVELFNLAISTDGVTWIDLGNVLGQPTSVDIDPLPGVVAGTQYSFVRLTDVSPAQSGAPFAEADIDAVGAISSGPPVVVPPPMGTVPEPELMLLLLLGLVGVGAAKVRRR